MPLDSYTLLFSSVEYSMKRYGPAIREAKSEMVLSKITKIYIDCIFKNARIVELKKTCFKVNLSL